MNDGSARQLLAFARTCTVPFALVGGKIVCTRKLGARPPDCLIPGSILQLHEQYTSGQISKDDDRARWWDVRKLLRRYCLIDAASPGRHLRRSNDTRKCHSVVVIAVVLAVLHSIDWSALTPSLAALVLMLALLYWTTTLLPGPVKRLGRAAGRHVLKSIKKDKHG